jgi:hypothetical protein
MTTTSSTVLITGNTYPVKDSLRALGGRWDPSAKGWRVPSDRAEQARSLVSGAPSGTYHRAPSRRVTRTGCRCGSVEEYSRDSDCWSCRHDAE